MSRDEESAERVSDNGSPPVPVDAPPEALQFRCAKHGLFDATRAVVLYGKGYCPRRGCQGRRELEPMEPVRDGALVAPATIAAGPSAPLNRPTMDGHAWTAEDADREVLRVLRAGGSKRVLTLCERFAGRATETDVRAALRRLMAARQVATSSRGWYHALAADAAVPPGGHVAPASTTGAQAGPDRAPKTTISPSSPLTERRLPAEPAQAPDPGQTPEKPPIFRSSPESSGPAAARRVVDLEAEIAELRRQIDELQATSAPLPPDAVALPLALPAKLHRVVTMMAACGFYGETAADVVVFLVRYQVCAMRETGALARTIGRENAD